MESLDWSLVSSFLAVAETGSLSAAARKTGISQPTLGRHIAQIEGQLGVVLFQRGKRGLDLTEAGLSLLPAATDMRAAAARLSLAAAGQVQAMTGTVRLTASRIVSYHVLPAILAQLRKDEPGIQIDLVPSDTSENLLYREADIALRMYRPTQEDLITRHVRDFPLALYASPDYLARRGHPQTVKDLLALDFIGFDRSDLQIRMMAAFGIAVSREDFPLRCDDQLVYWALVRAGCGIGAMQRHIGDADPAVVRLDGLIELPALPLWLTAPPGLRRTPRIARVWDALLAGLSGLRA